MRKKIIAGNWKMNKGHKETTSFLTEVAASFDSAEADVVLCVPYLSVGAALQATKGSAVKIGVQNIYYEDAGAYTGEISAVMLKDLQIEFAIIGHSERRQYFGETDEIVNKKAKKAIEHGICPIICVGESLLQREQGITNDLLRLQTKIAYYEIPASSALKTVIAYEPVWAIGTGITATSDQAEEACAAIRQVLAEIYDKPTSESIRIQYGGSVTADNAKELFARPNIDGGLVGGASLKADFARIVHYDK